MMAWWYNKFGVLKNKKPPLDSSRKSKKRRKKNTPSPFSDLHFPSNNLYTLPYVGFCVDKALPVYFSILLSSVKEES